jgi:hypothetical protein
MDDQPRIERQTDSFLRSKHCALFNNHLTDQCNSMKRAFLLTVLIFNALLLLPVSIGCSAKKEPTPEELEKVRQHKIKQAERFQKEG